MADETSYLELSEENGGAHKFYEVATSDTQVQIRYGRIGDQGQTQSNTHVTAMQLSTRVPPLSRGSMCLLAIISPQSIASTRQVSVYGS